MQDKVQAPKTKHKQELNESQGQGGISTIKFATVEVKKEPSKRLVVKKINIGKEPPAQNSSVSCEEKAKEQAMALTIAPWNEHYRKEQGHDAIPFSTLVGANKAIFGQTY